MNTAELAIVVTGSVSVLVGLGAPALFAFFERGREKRRFAHERDLRDRDVRHLRLDDVADAIDTLRRRTATLLDVLEREEPNSPDLAEPTADASAAVNDAEVALARLALWIDLTESPGREAYLCLHELDRIVTSIRLQRDQGHGRELFPFQELLQRRLLAARLSSEFVEQARERFGPQ